MGLFRSKPSQHDSTPPSSPEDRYASIGPGVPGRCPSCGGLGYIDSIDIGHRFQIQHCKDCHHRWEYLFDSEGAVVGLTELDDTGQPVARTRVRNRPSATKPPEPSAPPEPPEPAAPKLPVDPPPVDRADNAVIDLRDPAPVEDDPAGTDEPRARDHMSPAEWLRHSLRR